MMEALLIEVEIRPHDVQRTREESRDRRMRLVGNAKQHSDRTAVTERDRNCGAAGLT
jgi:hypothetical protein